MTRISPRPIFLEARRKIFIYFYTSNLAKFLQARLVLEKAGLEVRHFESRSEPYSERYGKGAAYLLSKAVAEITAHVGFRNLVFIEDTSLRIEALSVGGEDFPGQRVKEWFAQTTFDELDTELLAHGDGNCQES